MVEAYSLGHLCFGARERQVNVRVVPTGKAIFFTNAILCLKAGGLQSEVHSDGFSNCGKRFLKPTVDIVQPKVLVTLGEHAYKAIAVEYGIALLPFKAAVETEGGFRISEVTTLHPVYHCGRRILNTHRPLEIQLKDWARIGPTLARCSR